MRTKEIYEITKKEIADGVDIYEYIPIMYYLVIEEDYEALEGIRLAIADMGIEFIIPETEKELDIVLDFIQSQKTKL